MYAFEVSADDVANVLLLQTSRLINPEGLSMVDLAAKVEADVDLSQVEAAALSGGLDLDEQTTAAYAEIERQLVVCGALTPSVPVVPMASGPVDVDQYVQRVAAALQPAPRRMRP